MKGEQIIEVLESLKDDTDDNAVITFLDSVIDIIKCQGLEIEGLEETRYELACVIDDLREERERLLQKLQQAKSEAIKEFAERLKSISIGLEIGDDKKFKMTVVSTVAIDKVAKEMTEVKENEKQ